MRRPAKFVWVRFIATLSSVFGCVDIQSIHLLSLFICYSNGEMLRTILYYSKYEPAEVAKFGLVWEESTNQYVITTLFEPSIEMTQSWERLHVSIENVPEFLVSSLSLEKKVKLKTCWTLFQYWLLLWLRLWVAILHIVMSWQASLQLHVWWMEMKIFMMWMSTWSNNLM